MLTRFPTFVSFKRGFIFLISLLSVCSHLLAQPNIPLELNGVLYQVVFDEDEKPRETFLWSLELEELSRSYTVVESSVQRKRANTLFFSDVSGRDWRKMWGKHMREVYADDPEQVNDHAEAFFAITGSFPEVFESGDEFSLERSLDGATRAYVNDALVAQSLKPGHFEFWLRAWHTGQAMPKTFRGNLLAGGFIPDDLMIAYINSAPPAPVRPALDSETENSNDQSISMIDQDETASIVVESLVQQGVVPVILDGAN